MFTLWMRRTPPNFCAGSTVPYQSREPENCSHPQGPITLASSHFAGESVFLSTCQKFNLGEWILPQMNTVWNYSCMTEGTCELKSLVVAVLTHLVSWWLREKWALIYNTHYKTFESINSLKHRLLSSLQTKSRKAFLPWLTINDNRMFCLRC